MAPMVCRRMRTLVLLRVSDVATAFVLGSANTLSGDLAAAYSMIPVPDTVIAVNSAGMDYEGVLPHFCTLHTEKIVGWLDARRNRGLPDPENFWTSNIKQLPPSIAFRRVPSWDGSSGLLAVTVALYMGYEKVVLCGIPLDKQAAHYNINEPWMDAPRYRHAWTKNMPCMRDRVKSMSGWTRNLLGAPTLEWLQHDDQHDP